MPRISRGARPSAAPRYSSPASWKGVMSLRISLLNGAAAPNRIAERTARATATIMMILASAILPMGRVAVRRQREIELRRELRKMRQAIDLYKQAVDQGLIGDVFFVKAIMAWYKADVDACAKGQLNQDQFEKQVQAIMY